MFIYLSAEWVLSNRAKIQMCSDIYKLDLKPTVGSQGKDATSPELQWSRMLITSREIGRGCQLLLLPVGSIVAPLAGMVDMEVALLPFY